MGPLDSIVNAPRQQKVIFGVMLLVIVGALSYFLLISPAATDRDGLRQQNEVLRAEVLKARADEAGLRPFRAQVEALRKRLETAKERLPSEREIPRLYRQVSDLASQAGLGVALFQPKNPEDRDVLTEVPIAVTVECSYNQLGAFFEKLGRLPRIVSLNDFKFTGIERPTGTVRAEMTLATYVFRPEGAPPPPKPGAPAPAPPPAAGQPGAPR